MSAIEKVKKIKADYQAYKLTKEEAEELAEPILKEINQRSAEIAKRYNKKPVVFTLDNI